MRPPATRILRRILLAVVVAVAVAVAWTLRRPAAPRPIVDSSSGEPAEGTTIGDMTFFRFEGGDQRLQVKARDTSRAEEGAWHYKGVEVTFPFVARGEESTATVTADECLYDPDKEEARFSGNVHVVTADGFELTTESLDYLGSEGRIVSKTDVQFGRGTTSGRARGAVYDMTAETILLQSKVWLRFEGEGEAEPPTEIEAGRARGERRTRLIRFLREVELRQGARTLTSKRLRVRLDENLEAIEHAAAIEDVDLRTSGGGDVGGGQLPPGGERRLRARRLNVGFRSQGVLREATAINNAVLELWPRAGDPPEVRRIAGRLIQFDFDREGRLSGVMGWVAGRPQDGPVVLTSEPVRPGEGGQRRVECRRFRAHLDAASGAFISAKFTGAVAFSEPGRRGWAEEAVFMDATRELRLRGGAPRILDEVDGSELQAERIDLATDTRSVVAEGGVRHAVSRGADGPEGGMLAGSEPAVLVCRRFEYDAAARKAWYRENALLMSGKDEVRAPLIVLEDPAPSERRLHASGGVVSLLHPRTASDSGEEPASVNTRSQEMVYEEAAGRVVYTGDVQIRQGDIVTLSPEAVVTLTESRDDVYKIVAGEPVEVRQGQRRAEGRTGTYTPGNETMVLEGDEVVLQDVDRSIRGRVLTFQVGEDRIRVDGQEAVRTEAIFKKRELSIP